LARRSRYICISHSGKWVTVSWPWRIHHSEWESQRLFNGCIKYMVTLRLYTNQLVSQANNINNTT
jgi:hypothetical protein